LRDAYYRVEQLEREEVLPEQQKRIGVPARGMRPKITNSFFLCDGEVAKTLRGTQCAVGRQRAD
jgi:hypothetical protein